MKKIISPTFFVERASRLFGFGNQKDSVSHQPNREPKIGLALSSGGARGLTHIGVLQEFEEHGIPVHEVSGASMGAYIGAHLSRGISAHEMERIAARIKDKSELWKLADPIIPPVRGFFKGDKTINFLKEAIGDPNFNDLIMPFHAISFDLDTQEKLTINSGNVANAVHASCAIPGVISPVEWNGRRCSDGGVVDPVPVSILKEQPHLDIIIAVSLIPTLEDIKSGKTLKQADEDPPNFKQKVLGTFNRSTNLFADGNTVDTLRRSVRASQAQIADYACREADAVIRPDAFNLPWHCFESFESLIEAGRAAAREQIPHIKELINNVKHTNKKPTKVA